MPYAYHCFFTPSDCFEVAYEAVRIAVQHMTPVIILSDGVYSKWCRTMAFSRRQMICLPFLLLFKKGLDEGEEKFLPYKRDEKLVRPWAIPGVAGLEHRIGGLEKQDVTGNVNYEPENHQHMVFTRQAKVDRIAQYIPEQKLDSGPERGKVLVLGWGSTYGAIKSAVLQLQAEGHAVSHAHLRYVRPFPRKFRRYTQKLRSCYCGRR
jgi:2-oxoglutarate ferredoxin oxidoreductase subunit alpha